VRSESDGEKPEEWDAILGTAKPPTPDEPSIPVDPTASIDPPIPEAIEPPLADSVVADAYQRSYSTFIPDRTSYGHRDPKQRLDDSLGVGVYAGHFAQLIAAKDTFMPLSIGLFGAWGSGKSHFIDLLDEQLGLLMDEPSKVFHKQIVQVRFNAWHYLDTNLWANLVSEIFDQLFAKLEKREDTTPEQVKLLKKRLAEQSALAGEATAALATAETARQLAEDTLIKAVQQRAQQETNVRDILNDLKSLLTNDPKMQKQLAAIARGLGLPRVATSFAELEARAQEMRSLGGRTKALLLAVFSGRGWWKRVVLLALALAAPLGVLETRATLRAGLADRVRAATDIELEKQTRLRKTADFKEGVDATNQRRLPKFLGR
jgi:negative regulator of replication initiation